MTAYSHLDPAGRAQLSALADASFARLWDRVVALVEQRGLALGESTVGLSAPSDAERVAIAGLLGKPHSTGEVLRVRLADLDSSLRGGPLRAGLLDVLALLGREVRDRSSEEDKVRRAIDDVLERARRSRLASEAWFQRWLDGLEADGTVRKYVGDNSTDTIRSAIALFEQLPAEGLPLPVLAARVTGTTKGLDPGVFSTLVLRGLAFRAGVAKPKQTAERRALWESFGGVVDGLASHVLVVNLPAVGRSRLDEWLRGAAEDGVPLRLTLNQLTTYHLAARPSHVWLCENPAVIRAAAQRLGPRCSPIVCSEGQPSTAFDLLLDALARHGCEFAYHGDFDWPGIRIATGIRARHGAATWRMGSADYRAAVSTLGSVELPGLEGDALPTPWDPELRHAMVDARRSVFEESVVETLLEDLAVVRAPKPSGQARGSIREVLALSRCAHRVYLDRHGDRAHQLATSSFLEMLWDDSILDEETAIRGRDVVCIDRDAAPDVRRRHTLEAMTAGAPLISGAHLDVGDLIGRAPLLTKVDQTSSFGAFAYLPAIVRRGANDGETEPDAQHTVQLCGLAELLEHAQGWKPATGIIIGRDGSEQRVDLEAFRPRYRELRRRLRRILLGVEPTRPGRKSECGMCHWQTHCHETLVATDDVTLVPSIGDTERDRLFGANVKSREELATVATSALEHAGIGKRRAQNLIRAARVQRSGVPEVLGQWNRPRVEVEIAYDIEDAVFDPFVYLHGLLVRRAASFEHAPVCARLPESERDVWGRFVDQVRRLKAFDSYCVYVYGAHERTTLRRLARQYGDAELIEAFSTRFVDVHDAVKNSIVLPTESYGLKAVARSIGFEWRESAPGGAESLVWWADYVRDPKTNAASLDRIIAYNEDDLRATFAVVDWLERTTSAR